MSKLYETFMEFTKELTDLGYMNIKISPKWRRLKEQINKHRNFETALKELIG